MNVFKIAKRILSDYIYDPDHVKNPPAHFHKTEKGWSDNKGVKSKGFYKENIRSLSPYAMSFIEPFLKEDDEKNFSKSFNKDYSHSDSLPVLLYNLSENSESRDWMNGKVNETISNRTDRAWNKIDDLIEHYTSVCHMDKQAGTLSRLIGLSMGNGGVDWRMKKHGFKEPTNEMVKNVRLYEKNEQEMLLHTGLVDKSGYVTIYRNTSHPPVDGVYIGGFIESWSLTPEIKTSKHKTKTFLITTTVPLSKVIASFVGRGGNWIHSDEYEILIESSYLTNVRVIASENITVESEDCFDRIRENYKSIDEIVDAENKRNFVHSLQLENLKDISNPTTKDLMELRKMSPEYRAMTQTELIILFKTLSKEGYFLKNGNFGK